MVSRSKILRTPRRNFLKPEPGAVFSIDEIPLVADVPPVVVAQAIASGQLQTLTVDGVTLVDGADLCTWIAAFDARIAATKDAA